MTLAANARAGWVLMPDGLSFERKHLPVDKLRAKWEPIVTEIVIAVNEYKQRHPNAEITFSFDPSVPVTELVDRMLEAGAPAADALDSMHAPCSRPDCTCMHGIFLFGARANARLTEPAGYDGGKWCAGDRA